MKKALIIASIDQAFQTVKKDGTLVLKDLSEKIVKTPSGALMQAPYKEILLVRENRRRFIWIVYRPDKKLHKKFHAFPFSGNLQKEETVDLLEKHKILPTKTDFRKIEIFP
jgi:hypothetical protein